MEANEEVVTECESRKKGVKEKKHSLGRNKESNAGWQKELRSRIALAHTYPILDIHLNLIRVAASKNRK